MSDPEVPQNEQKSDVDDVVDSANAGLAEAEAARADVSNNGTGDAPAADPDATGTDAAHAPAADQDAAPSALDSAVDPDLAAFEAAEREHPGTFGSSEPAVSFGDDRASSSASGDSSDWSSRDAATESDRGDSDRFDSGNGSAGAAAAATGAAAAGSAASDDDRLRSDDDRLRSDDFRTSATAEESIADTAYAPPAAAEPETRVLPSEPYRSEAADTVVAAPVQQQSYQQQQPIFVQAPEPPRERGNRGTAGGIGLLATIVFAILYLAIGLGWRALQGDLNGTEIVEDVLATLTTWGFWVPVAVFFIGFWLLGAIINRGRWGLWVVFGLLVGVAAYGGYILGQLFEAPFWQVTASEANALVGEQLFAPMAIAAFVLGRELTIWFGAWVARSGARKTELNDEAQREYERTLEAGPTLSR